jgi:ABC-type multidrug transport system ATPase subunit
LVASDLRVDVDGVPACDGLAFTTSGDRLLVLGAPRALFEAVVGLRPVVRGAIAVRGLAPGAAVDDRIIAGVPLDPPLPPKWNLVEYIEWSSRLAGHSKAEARRLGSVAIGKMQLGAMVKNPLGSLVAHARRAVVLASALATNAEVLVLEDPLAGLPEELARAWARILVAALDDKAWITFAPRVPLTSPLALAADEAICVSSTRLLAQGAPAEIAAADKRYVARIQGPVEALGARMVERGGRLQVQGAQVLLDLGETLTTAELLGLCAEADVTVVEMLPIARALG